jgi:NAD(P)-dependent dehydrogenase (short-subunit alcohol dehydrogenase family)
MDLGLAGRVALVTRSSQGIGRAAALLFGSEGARVAVTYHRERDRAQAVVDEIENGGGEAVATELDLAARRHLGGRSCRCQPSRLPELI